MMETQSSLWYDHFQGALYPLDLSECASCVAASPQMVKSLVHLAAAHIVKDATCTKNALAVLPQELCIPLMQQAMENGRDRAMDVLLSQWPHSTLSLEKFAPNIFTSLQLLYEHSYLVKKIKQSLRYTTCVAHTFLDTLKNGSPTKLKYIDLSGYPTAEVITYYIATHCMLAHNESRQNVMIRQYNDAIRQLKNISEEHNQQRQGPFQDFEMAQSLPGADSYAIKLDVFITSENTLVELCKALKVSSFPESKLKMFVQKLDATCLGDQNVKILMEQLDPQHLTGLRLKYNSLNAKDFQTVAPEIQRFTHLTALDLSCNNINIYQNEQASQILADTLRLLPCLARLDLSNNRLKSKLRRILCGINRPLEYLRLVGCGLTFSDMTYLSVCHHTAALREVDLSENSLHQHARCLSKFLQSVSSTICVLELEETALTDPQFVSLLASFVELQSLLYVNISGNVLMQSVLDDVCRAVAKLPKIQAIRASYPKDCYSDPVMNNEEEERYKIDVVMSLKQSMFIKRHSLCLTGMPDLIMTELEQEIT